MPGHLRVAITGSSGLIGSGLARSLGSDGHEVVRVVRSGGSGPGRVAWDIDRGEIDTAGLEGLDAVVHLAGEGIGDHRWSEEQKRRILESRTKGTELLVTALAGLDARPPVLLSGSAIGGYGNRGDEQLTEMSALGTGFLAEVVIAWEAAAEPAEAAGIRVPRIRTGIVLDPGGGALQQLARLCRFGILGKLGNGKQWMSWISLADHIAAMRFLLDPGCDLRGPVNLTAPAPVTNEVFTKSSPCRGSGRSCCWGPSWRRRCSTRGSACCPTASSTPGSSSATPSSNPPCRSSSAEQPRAAHLGCMRTPPSTRMVSAFM
jgi:uncharacterized protein (TIGR01777 family)